MDCSLTYYKKKIADLEDHITDLEKQVIPYNKD